MSNSSCLYSLSVRKRPKESSSSGTRPPTRETSVAFGSEGHRNADVFVWCWLLFGFLFERFLGAGGAPYSVSWRMWCRSGVTNPEPENTFLGHSENPTVFLHQAWRMKFCEGPSLLPAHTSDFHDNQNQ